MFFPKGNHFGRSAQSGRNYRENQNKPILEKYSIAIDKFLLTGKKGREKAEISLRKWGKVSNFLPVLAERNFSTLGLDDLKLPSCKNRNFSMIEGGRKYCVTPAVRGDKRERYRAKSVQSKGFGKMSKILQTDEKVIIEDDSQEEESPEKFRPIYS